MDKFKLVSKYKPKGDQPKAIAELTDGVLKEKRNQVLLGVTGSGKTFTMANIIEKVQKTSLIIAHNKTLAAQLYSEMSQYFPDNAVEYFVSYYDYYQPEAYIPQTGLYIEKDALINDEIDKLRHRATRSLIERKDTIIISSVSCIYGLGNPDLYLNRAIKLYLGEQYDRKTFIKELIELQYKRVDANLIRGSFRIRGSNIDIIPAHLVDLIWRISIDGGKIKYIYEIDYITGDRKNILEKVLIFPNTHHISTQSILKKAIRRIKKDLNARVSELKDLGKYMESDRLEKKVNFDLEMMKENGSCKGIENYSFYFSERKKGSPPPTLFEYLPKDALLFIDESHVTIPQIASMYNGDRARKENLIEHGFRLPSALDNRPLKYEEWDNMRPQTIFVSATPGNKELNYSNNKYVEQIIRPTGLLDPVCLIKPCETQIDNLIKESKKVKKHNNKVLVTTLTKKMAEELSDYLNDVGVKAVYMHSEIKTLERVKIIQDLRKGIYDVLVGVNLLREGLDIPECALVAILDADKEGFLRSETAIIQTIGRASRNSNGKVILYADHETVSIKKAVYENNRRRAIQEEYNSKNNIVPKTIKKDHNNVLENVIYNDNDSADNFEDNKIINDIKILEQDMINAADNLEFEKAAKLKNKIKLLKQAILI